MCDDWMVRRYYGARMALHAALLQCGDGGDADDAGVGAVCRGITLVRQQRR